MKKKGSEQNVPKEGDDEIDSEEKEEEEKEKKGPDQVEMLNKLTGCPTSSDTILTALPMCAPYSMMVNHKYKIKLQPGTLK